jgi:hypothetical protein
MTDAIATFHDIQQGVIELGCDCESGLTSASFSKIATVSPALGESSVVSRSFSNIRNYVVKDNRWRVGQHILLSI